MRDRLRVSLETTQEELDSLIGEMVDVFIYPMGVRERDRWLATMIVEKIERAPEDPHKLLLYRVGFQDWPEVTLPDPLFKIWKR